MAIEKVSLISHADWSKNPKKCWMAFATRHDNYWFVPPLINVSEPSSVFRYLKTISPQQGCILAGFDFPIGLPYSYAEKAGITNFLTAIKLFGVNEWANFYNPAEVPSQISLFRPFYPLKPSNSKRQDLELGLGLSFSNLFRLCEVAHKDRRAACPLFWTVGGQQVGKAAIHGWKSLLSSFPTNPELRIQIWPFSGSLENLTIPGNIIVVETYPAEFYGHLGLFALKERRSKRRQADRKFLADKFISWGISHNLILDETINNLIKDGFGNYLHSEDQFDALVGLYGMINVIQGNHRFSEPVNHRISKIEGWIFGQEIPKGF